MRLFGLYALLGLVILAMLALPFLVGWAKRDPVGGLVLLGLVAVMLIIFLGYRMRYGYFPGDEHLLLQSPQERRRNSIKAWSGIAVMLAFVTVLVIYLDSTAKPERKILRQIEDYFARLSY